MKSFLGYLCGTMIGFLLSMYTGYVLSILWGWFVVDLFNLPEINVVVGMGICLICSIVRLDTTLFEYKGDYKELMLQTFSYIVARNTSVLLFGYLYLQFI